MAGKEVAKDAALVTVGAGGYGLGTEALMNKTSWTDGTKAGVQAGAGIITGAIAAYFQPQLGVGIIAGGLLGGAIHGLRAYRRSGLMRQVAAPAAPAATTTPASTPASLPAGTPPATTPAAAGVYNMSAGRFR